MSAVYMPNNQQQQQFADGTWPTTAPTPSVHPSQQQQQPMQQQQQQYAYNHQQSSSALVPLASTTNQWGVPVQTPQQQQIVPSDQLQHQQSTHQFDPFAAAPAPAPVANGHTSAMVPTPAAAIPYQNQQYQNQAPAPIAQVPAPAPTAMIASAPSDNPFDVFQTVPANNTSSFNTGSDHFPSTHNGSASHLATVNSGYVTPSTSTHNSSFLSTASTSANSLSAPGDAFAAAPAAAVAPSWLDVPASDLLAPVGNTAAAAHSFSTNKNELPAEGDYYQVEVVEPHLGFVLYSASDLSTTILRHHHPNTLKSLGTSVPVVAHLGVNSSAAISGVSLGDILVAINGTDVHNHAAAGRMLRQVPRPVTLRMYRLPGPPPTVFEGQIWCHYKNKSVEPPRKTKDWKSKYVVVGGIMGRRSVVNMFRSRAEYDRAVTEAHQGLPVSVKVKQFSLEGASIWSLPAEQGGKQTGMESLKYPTESESWNYMQVLMPKPSNNIKLAVPESQQQQLRLVLEGIRRGL